MYRNSIFRVPRWVPYRVPHWDPPWRCKNGCKFAPVLASEHTKKIAPLGWIRGSSLKAKQGQCSEGLNNKPHLHRKGWNLHQEEVQICTRRGANLHQKEVQICTRKRCKFALEGREVAPKQWEFLHRDNQYLHLQKKKLHQKTAILHRKGSTFAPNNQIFAPALRLKWPHWLPPRVRASWFWGSTNEVNLALRLFSASLDALGDRRKFTTDPRHFQWQISRQIQR